MLQEENGQQDEIPEDVVLVPFERDVLRNTKCVKFSEAEIGPTGKITRFQEWLATTINPDTGLPFIPMNSHSAMIKFCLNYTFKAMGVIATQMAKAEAEEITT